MRSKAPIRGLGMPELVLHGTRLLGNMEVESPGPRFWYEGGQTFTAGQLAEIRLSSLGRVICDNADNIRRVPSNVFLNTDLSQFLDCSQVYKPSLNPWTGQSYLITRGEG